MLDASGFLVCSVVITFAFLTWNLDRHVVGAMLRQRREEEEFAARNGGRGRQFLPVTSLPSRQLRNAVLFGGRLGRNQGADTS